MYLSKYNIISNIKDSKNYFIMNLLSGNLDILNNKEANDILDGSLKEKSEYEKKGYIISKDEENRIFKNKYLDFIDQRDNDEIQLFFVLNYTCNFSCSYCYQKEYSPDNKELSGNIIEIIDSFFNYIENEFGQKNKYITIFGGEPLLPDKATRDALNYLMSEANKRDIEVAIVTNGYNLEDYIEDLKKYKIREIQVTLDGTEEIHNKRRPLKNSSGTFKRIVSGIDLALENNFPLNLRIVLDKENINDLADFAEFVNKKGWVKNDLFKTQIGRNYDLHSCQKNSNKLFSRIELYKEIYKMIKEQPVILDLYKPNYSVIKHLYENGELPEPLFDSCPGCKTEWAFDHTGKIYPCTATVGEAGESVGSFYPTVVKNNELISLWQDRDVTGIPECRDCNLQFACGGGCASVAKESNGKILSPDCRPVKELIEMGISLYYKKELENVG